MKSRLRYCSKSSDRFLNIIKRCFGNNPSQIVNNLICILSKVIIWHFMVLSKASKSWNKSFRLHWSDITFWMSFKIFVIYSWKLGKGRPRCNLKLLIRMFSAKNESLYENFWKIGIAIMCKRRCVFSMVIWPACRMGKYTVNDHPYGKGLTTHPSFIAYVEIIENDYELIRTRLQVLLHWSIRGLTDYEFYNPSSIYTNQEA